MDLGFFKVSPDVRKNTLKAAEILRQQGAQVTEVDLPWTADVRKAFTDALVFPLGRLLEQLIEGREEQANDYVRAMAIRSRSITLDDHLASFDQLAHMHQTLQDVFENHDALICPTLADNRWLAEGSDTPHEDLMNAGMTYPFNMLSRHPVLSVPSGVASHGVPTGLQIIGPTYEDAVVMRIGAALEQELGWPSWRPPVQDQAGALATV
jgi:Asp-tRNA(Asn)/Glu-tRNA(Gln) amidotransferase A subunit family amidase